MFMSSPVKISNFQHSLPHLLNLFNHQAEVVVTDIQIYLFETTNVKHKHKIQITLPEEK